MPDVKKCRGGGVCLFTSWRMEVLTKEQLLVRRLRELMNFHWHLTCRSLQVCTCVYLKEVDLRISFVNDFTKPSPWFTSLMILVRAPTTLFTTHFTKNIKASGPPPHFSPHLRPKTHYIHPLAFLISGGRKLKIRQHLGLEKRDALDTLEGAPSVEKSFDFWDPAKGRWFCWFLPWGYLLQTTEFPKKCSLKIVDWFVKNCRGSI